MSIHAKREYNIAAVLSFLFFILRSSPNDQFDISSDSSLINLIMVLISLSKDLTSVFAEAVVLLKHCDSDT